jgi:S-adenosylmethionine:tRNA-ribosyltransferase-isomerase (queuine synthetase)
MIDLSSYDYTLPEDLVANTPASPRDAARLFVYHTRTDTVTLDIFRNIGSYLPPKTLLVLNDTTVIPARLWLKKETGGKIEVLLMMNELRPGDTTVKGGSLTARSMSVRNSFLRMENPLMLSGRTSSSFSFDRASPYCNFLNFSTQKERHQSRPI